MKLFINKNIKEMPKYIGMWAFFSFRKEVEITD
jgi:hypothetical protein